MFEIVGNIPHSIRIYHKTNNWNAINKLWLAHIYSLDKISRKHTIYICEDYELYDYKNTK